MKKWLGRLVSLILILVFLMGGFVVVKVLTTPKNKVPEIFGYSLLNVQTGSMANIFAPGEVILIKKIDPSKVKVGDVISFYSEDPALNGMPNTHRVIEIGEENGAPVFTTKGDMNPLKDEYPVHAERVVGLYLKNLHSFSKIITFFKSPYAFFFLLVIPVAAILAVEGYRVAKISQKKQEEKAKNHAEEPK